MRIKRLLKRIKHSRRKTSMLSLVLVILVFGLTLGYAYVHTTLEVDGTVNVSSANWNVYWDNIVIGSDNHADVTTTPTISTGKTEVTFSVTFNDPGDKYEFTVDAVNDGTIDAMISNVDGGVYETDGVTSKLLPDYLEYSFTYDDGIEIGENHLLASGTTETYLVSVHYKEGFDTSQLPTEDDDYVFKFGVNYVQKAKTAVARPQPLTRYSGAWGNYRIGDNYANSFYSTAEEAMNSWGSEKPFYLKHKVVEENKFLWSVIGSDGLDSCLSGTCFNTESSCIEDISGYATDNGDGTYSYDEQTLSCSLQEYHFLKIMQSYVEFVISDEMASTYGLTVGTYSLRGGDGVSFYENNKSTLLNAFGSENCTESNNSFSCHIAGLKFSWSASYENVFVDEAFGNGCTRQCFIDNNGNSSCSSVC